MKTRIQLPTILLVLGMLGAACSGYGATEIAAPAESIQVAGEAETAVKATDTVAVANDGTTSMDLGILNKQLEALPRTDPTDEEIEGLMYMREEEKLALDVYLALYEQWDLPIFGNIAGAEQTHTDSVAVLLDYYGIADPAMNTEPGVFVNAELQSLYDDLVASGSQSLTDALLVGALIEDVDIYDIRQLASENPAIDLVYSNLERGSRNHMRAFVRQLDRSGVEYAPTYLSQESFDEIISNSTEQGSQGQGSQGQGGQGQGGQGQGGQGRGQHGLDR